MVVDDHEDVRFLIRAIIEDADADVVVVGEATGSVRRSSRSTRSSPTCSCSTR